MGYHAEFSNFDKSPNKEDLNDKKEKLELLVESYGYLVEGQTNWVANLSNASSLIWHCYKSLPLDINWAGFYVYNKGVSKATPEKSQKTLILGPFQGKVACQEILFGKGVCGTAAETLETQLVPNVDEFPGHIACDGETKSEIVVPIINTKTNECIGVIDIDCLEINGFDSLDTHYLELLAAKIASTCKFD